MDSYQHIFISLANLFSYLLLEDHHHIVNVRKTFPNMTDDALLKKGVYPYDVMDEENKMALPSLPDQGEFYSVTLQDCL